MLGRARLDNVRSSLIEDADLASGERVASTGGVGRVVVTRMRGAVMLGTHREGNGVAYLVSKFFDGMGAFHQRSGPGYGDKERNWNTVLKNGHGGGQSYLGFRMLAWPLVEEGFIPGFWARI